MKVKTFDHKFDDSQDISAFLDLKAAKRPGHEQRRVNLDLPVWLIDDLDREAERVGVTRQSMIKMWLADRLDGSS